MDRIIHAEITEKAEKEDKGKKIRKFKHCYILTVSEITSGHDCEILDQANRSENASSKCRHLRLESWAAQNGDHEQSTRIHPSLLLTTNAV